MRHARVVSALGVVILLGGCSDVLEVPRHDQEIKPLMTVDIDSRLAALGVSRQVKQSRRRGGDRDSVDVIRCVLRKQQANGRYRSWKVALPVPGDRPGPNARYRTFKYRGVPEGSTRATHTADCIVPNNADAIRLAYELITGSAPDTATSATSGAAFGASVKRTLSQLASTLFPRPLAAAATSSAQDVWYCFQEHEGYALCHLPGIEVTAPPPPPPLDDCGAGPDPYESGLWCECWEYSEEPFWCAYEFDWEDWPVHEESGGSGGGGGGGISVSVNCTPSSSTRGGNVNCTASATGGPLLVIKWTFNPQSGSGLGPVDGSTTTETWGGPVAIGGSVTVTAMDGSDTTYASTSISVSPQTLQVVKSSTTMGQGQLPAEPHQDHELGYSDLALPWMPQGWSQAIGSGPNAGVVYVASSPFYADSEVYINQTALASGSAFMNAQTGGQYCTTSQLSNLGTLVLAHEQQHLDVYHAHAEARINSEVEPLVKFGASGLQDLVEAANDKRASIDSTAYVASDAVDQTSPVPVPCDIKWSY